MSFHWGRTGPKNLQTKNTSSLYLLTSQKQQMKEAEKYLEGHRVLKELPLSVTSESVTTRQTKT